MGADSGPVGPNTPADQKSGNDLVRARRRQLIMVIKTLGYITWRTNRDRIKQK